MRPRDRIYLDINFSEKDLRRLKRGNTVHKHIQGGNFAFHVKQKDWKIRKQILKYQQKIKELQSQ